MTTRKAMRFVALVASAYISAASCGPGDTGGPTAASGGSGASGSGAAPGSTASGGAAVTGTGGSAPIGAGASSAETSASTGSTLAGLTPAEATALCEETLSAKLLQVQAASCAVTALSDAMIAEALGEDPVAACQTEYEACVAEPVAPPDCSGASTAFADCSATLDEYHQCQAESAAEWDALVSRLSCENYTPELLREGPTSGDSPTCEAIEAKCPGTLEAVLAER